MRGRRAPAGRLARGLDGVADVLAIAEAGLAERAPRGIEHGIGVAAVRPRLLAADIHFRRAVDARRRRRRPRRGAQLDGRRRLRRRAARGSFGSAEIFGQALAPAFAAEAALAVAAEAGAGVEQIGRIDPDDARLDAARRLRARG